MSKTLLISVLVIVVLIGGFLYLASDSTEEQTGTQTTDQQETQNVNEQADSDVGNFASLLASGQSLNCSYSTDALDAEYSTNGEMYISGEQFRADGTTIVDNEQQTFSVINDGTYMYMWGESNGESYAMRMEATDPEDLADTAQSNDMAFDYNQEVEYDCDPWVADSSRFEPPADVEFMDMSAMMNMEANMTPEQIEVMQEMMVQ